MMRSAAWALLLLAATGCAAQADGTALEISLSSVFVEDQAAALTFYTEILGFEKKADLPVGKFRWLTVVSPIAPEGPQLLLEPNANPAARTYQAALREQGIPAASFAVADIQGTYETLREAGVQFTMEPTATGSATVAVFDDTCGNLVQIYQEE